MVVKEQFDIQIGAAKKLLGDYKYNAVLHLDPMHSRNSISMIDITIRSSEPIVNIGEFVRLYIDVSDKTEKVKTKQSRLIDK